MERLQPHRRVALAAALVTAALLGAPARADTGDPGAARPSEASRTSKPSKPSGDHGATAKPPGPWEVKPPPKAAAPKRAAKARRKVRTLKPARILPPPPPWVQMDDVSVTGPGGSELVFDVPRSISVVSGRDMAERAVASAPDAVADVPGVWVQKPYFGSGTAFVRGLGGRRVLILENGLRLDDAARHAAPDDELNGVDPFSLSRVEVLRGPATVLYGEGALGGVVNLVHDTPTPGPRRLKGGAVFQVMSQTWEKGLHLAGEADAPYGGVRLSASYNGFDDLESPVEYVKFSGYQRADFLAQGTLRVGEGRLSAGWSGSRQFAVPRTDRCKVYPYYACTVDPEVFRDLYHLTWLSRLGAHTRVAATGYLKVRHRVEALTRDDLFLRRLDTVTVVSPGARLSVETQPVDALRLTAGLDAQTDRVGDETVLEEAGILGLPPQRPRLPTGSHQERAAAYALGRYRLGAVDLFAGGRLITVHDAAPALPGFPAVDRSFSSAVGTAGVKARFGHVLQLVADVGQGYRAPNLDDVAGFGLETAGYHVPTAALKPERSTTVEAGVKLFGRNVQAQIFAYETELTDAMIAVPARFGAGITLEGLPILALANTPHARLYGADVDAAVVLPYGLSVGVGGAFTVGDDLSRGVPFARVPPPFGRLRVRYTDRDQVFYSEVVLVAAEAQTRLAPEDRLDPRICDPKAKVPCSGTPGYVTLGVRAGVRLARAATLSVHLENLVNEHYRVHGSGLDAPAMGAGVRVTVNSF